MSSPNLPTPPPKSERKEISSEVRMVLAFILMGLILVATPYAYKLFGIAPVQQTADAAKSGSADKKASDTSKAPATPEQQKAATTASGAPMALSTAETATPLPAVAAAAEQTQVIDTDDYHVIFSNRGAVVKSWTLKNFKDSTGKPLELVNEQGAAKVGYPFSFTYRGKQPGTDLNKDLWVAHPEGTTMRFDFSDGQTVASKTFKFQPNTTLVQYADDVAMNGSGVPHLVQWRGGFGDMAVQSAAGQQATIRYDTEKQKLLRDAAKTGKNGPANADGSFSFAGIDDQYFTAAFLPPANTPLQTTTFDDVVPSKFNTAEEAYPGVAVGGAARNQLEVYIGPKEISALHRVNPKLDGIVDWGWFGIIAKPLFMVLHFINDQWVHNYGWAIIILTLFINVALFPLKLTNLKSMRKMQMLQPEMAKITEKYKGISMSDPRAANKQQETMDLYKKHGVNPMGGCLPLLIQMPFLYAFYRVIAVTVELRHANWLWVGDLSQPEHFAIRALPLIMVVTSFALQKMTPVAAGGDPSQQKMMQFMPLMYLFFFWNASSGLVLYWLTGNLVGMAQQWFFNKTAVPVAVPPRLPQKGKRA
ncbi:MAG TPA: membrane protein insertase YidC [Bryobacteraceae bacterium]|jgi:YidC/Oxa1 family membrane protein insertase|nr:membrane protein insertase YidC [Bryobacteraceae bacterium]